MNQTVQERFATDARQAPSEIALPSTIEDMYLLALQPFHATCEAVRTAQRNADERGF